MIPKYLLDRRSGVTGLLLWMGILSLIMTIGSLYLGKWPEAVSSLGVGAAIASALMAFEVVHQANINQLPQVIVRVDGESRYELLQLVIQNIGGSTAYNVRLEWQETYQDSPIKYNKPNSIHGGVVAIHRDPAFNRVIALQKGECHYIVIDGYYKFFNDNPSPTNYIARIQYSDQLIDGHLFGIDLPLSMEEARNTLDHTKESTKADWSITLLPKKVDKLINELTEIKNVLKKN